MSVLAVTSEERERVLVELGRGVTLTLGVTGEPLFDVAVRNGQLFCLLRDDQLESVRGPYPSQGGVSNHRINGLYMRVAEPGFLNQMPGFEDGQAILRGVVPGRYWLRSFASDIRFEPEWITVTALELRWSQRPNAPANHPWRPPPAESSGRGTAACVTGARTLGLRTGRPVRFRPLRRRRRAGDLVARFRGSGGVPPQLVGPFEAMLAALPLAVAALELAAAELAGCDVGRDLRHLAEEPAPEPGEGLGALAVGGIHGHAFDDLRPSHGAGNAAVRCASPPAPA